jgi:hypothetical protein
MSSLQAVVAVVEVVAITQRYPPYYNMVLMVVLVENTTGHHYQPLVEATFLML